MVGNCQPKWDNDSITLTSSSKAIQMYTVSKMVRSHSGSDSSVKFSFLLERIYVSYLLTTFGPCIVLCVLGSVTMIAFELNNFTDRVAITSSLLIVVASLFSQVVSTLPTSPTLKYVELFFFYVILRLAYVFAIHTLVMIDLKRSEPQGCTESKLFTKSQSFSAAKNSLAETDSKGQQSKVPRRYKLNKIGWILGFIFDFITIVTSFLYINNTKVAMRRAL